MEILVTPHGDFTYTRQKIMFLMSFCFQHDIKNPNIEIRKYVVQDFLGSLTLRNSIYPDLYTKCGPASSVGIATGCGLGGPGIESRWGRYFSHTSTPVLGPTQPPVQWVPGLSRG
jgi:hypothetical protein